MFCQSCGAQNSDGAAKCQSCGAEMVKAASVSTPNAQRPQYDAGYPEPQKTNGLAIASLVSGLLSGLTLFLGAIAGIILGVIALSQIKASGGRVKGRGLAIAGIVISAVAFFVVLPILAAVVYPIYAEARVEAKKSGLLNDNGLSTFSHAIEEARQSGCQSNEKQLALALVMYSQDYDECLPPAGKWADAIGTYVRYKKVFKCPSADDRALGYAFNRSYSAKSMAKVADPSSVLILFDSNASSWNSAGGPELVALRHKNGFNVASMDMKVKWVPNTKGLSWGQ